MIEDMNRSYFKPKRLKGFSVSTFSVSVIICSFYLIPADAQIYLNDNNVRVARHDKRRTSYKFPSTKDQLNKAGMLYQKNIYKPLGYHDRYLQHYEELPRCSRSQQKLIEVKHHTPGSEKFDVVYYSADEQRDRTQASQYGKGAIAYNPALLRDPKTNRTDYWQEFARFIRIHCLPTRFRFITVGKKRYMEFRTGAKAWSDK